MVRLEGRQLLADAVAADTPPQLRLAMPETSLAETARTLAPAVDWRPFA